MGLAYVHLNPAARQVLNRPACPSETLLALYPSALDTGIFAFYRDTFQSGQPGRFDGNYQHDDGYLTKPLTRENLSTVLSIHFNPPPHSYTRFGKPASSRRLFHAFRSARAMSGLRWPSNPVRLANPLWPMPPGSPGSW